MKRIETLSVSAIVKAVRRSARWHGRRVHVHTVASRSYTERTDIIGAALSRLGIHRDMLAALDLASGNPGSSIGSLLFEHGMINRNNVKDARWLCDAQAGQDMGMSWRDSVKWADRRVGERAA